MSARGFARLGLLVVGLGIGAAVASMPGVASADPSSPFDVNQADPSWLLAPAADSSPMNFDISINGMDVLNGHGTAVAESGTGDIAIAIGANSTANATGGTGDFAYAEGTNALAASGGNASSSYDSAIDIGNNVDPSSYPGAPDGAYAGAGSLIGNDAAGAGSGSHDLAIDFGNNGLSDVTGFPGDGGNSGAFAGAGGLIGAAGDGNNDFAYNVGNLDGFGLGPAAVNGNNDSASEVGNMTGTNLGSFAGNGNGDIASELGPNSSAFAGGEFGSATTGNYDLANVLDPFGTVGSTATAGAPGSYDLAAVLFQDAVTAVASGGDHISDILPDLFGASSASAVDGFSNLLSMF